MGLHVRPQTWQVSRGLSPKVITLALACVSSCTGQLTRCQMGRSETVTP